MKVSKEIQQAFINVVEAIDNVGLLDDAREDLLLLANHISFDVAFLTDEVGLLEDPEEDEDEESV